MISFRNSAAAAEQPASSQQQPPARAAPFSRTDGDEIKQRRNIHTCSIVRKLTRLFHGLIIIRLINGRAFEVNGT